MSEKAIIDFLFEQGQLKKIKNSGFRLIGIDNPSSVGAHALRAAQIGYVLALMEKYENPLEICSILVFHEIAETRTGDTNRVENNYITKDEKRAVAEQLMTLKGVGDEIQKLWEKGEDRTQLAGKICKDADMLEHSLTAKEYLERGHTHAQNWIDNTEKRLFTESAKKLMKYLKERNSNHWWQNLKKITYNKE